MRSKFGWLVLAALTAFGIGSAQAEQHLVMYSSNENTLNTLVADAFQKQTGIRVDVVSAGSGVLLRRMTSEAANPQADVVWGIGAALLHQNRKYFQPYVAKERDAVPAQYRDPDDLWLGTNLHILTINENTASIPADQGPKSWADLLDPKWKGKLAYTDPANSGSSYVTATLLLSMWGNGDAAAWDKMRRLLANSKVLNRSSLVFDGVGSGEYPLGISLEYAGYLFAHNGAPVKVIYPSDGTTVQPEGIAIVKGAKDLAAAREFVDFINSKPMQEAMLRVTFRRPARQDIDLSKLPGHMPELSSLKILPYDDAKWEAARKETLTRLRNMIQETR